MSGHAHSTVIENIEEAARKGFKFLAVTDHTGIMPDAPSETYFKCMWSAMPDEYMGVNILRGCEANILDETGKLDVSANTLSRLEWVIASIHAVLTVPMDIDAHTELWCNIAVKYLTEAGIPESAILNTDAERFAEHLSKMTGREFVI